MTKLDDIKRKIAAMMATAKNKAATEGEADNALRLAMNLMKKHSLTLEDIAEHKVHQADFIFDHQEKGRKTIREIDKWCGPAIARFCGIKMYADMQQGGIKFFGYNVDVELAVYIRDLLIRTGEFEWKRYKTALGDRVLLNRKGKPISAYKLRADFFDGFADRIIARLKALTGEMEEETNGKALVVLKNQLVNAAFAELHDGTKIKGGKTAKRTVFVGPHDAGRAAGDKVQFNRAMKATGGQKRLT